MKCQTGICSSPTHCKHVGRCADASDEHVLLGESLGGLLALLSKTIQRVEALELQVRHLKQGTEP